jgi:hypothetical protein
MQLLTQEIRQKLPALYSCEDKQPSDIRIVVKFFTPWSHWTWYAYEGSPIDANGNYNTDQPEADFLFFGWVEGDFPELGYFKLSELQSVRGPFGLAIERDRYYTPQTLQELMDTSKQLF